jgi:predicted Zn-dependent peptidase
VAYGACGRRRVTAAPEGYGFMAGKQNGRSRGNGARSLTWEVATLANGMRVVTTPVPTAQSASVNVFIGVGSRGEERRVNGISHYMEHMLFKGTEKRPNAIVIAEAIEGAGGALNAYTAKELTCYWNHVPYDTMPTAMEVLADMILHSKIEQEEIDRERTVVQQEIRRSHDQPGAWAGELLSGAVYGDQPIGWSIAGTVEIIEAMQRQDFFDHLERWYTPQNAVLSVAGNVTHEHVMELAEQHFSEWQGGPAPRWLPARPELAEERVKVEKRDIAQCNMAIGLRAIGRTDPDRFALTILNNILGRGMSSRLFKEVRERRGLAYSVGSSVSRHADTGTMSISAGVTADKLQEATTVILAELRRLVDEPVGEEEMTKARDYAAGSFRLGLESTMSLGQRAGEALLTMGEIEPVENVVEKLKNITAEDVQRVARRLFHTDNLAIAAVGPTDDTDGLAKLLTV